MARPVDPQRRRARRLQIIDAGLTAFAAHGYTGATTARICEAAGIGSGTFFHYFPTKADLLIAILELGTQETRDFFAAQQGRNDARQVVIDYVHHAAADLADERAAGFVNAVGSQIADDRVAAALTTDDCAVRSGLQQWIRQAQEAHTIRADLSVARIVDWVVLILDGFASQVAQQPAFDATIEAPLLHDLVDLLLTGATSGAALA